MPRAFLPRPAPGTSYPIAPSRPGDFAAEDAALLATIGRNMGVARARSEGRVPNPASRAYAFYAALFGLALSQVGNQPAEAESDRLVREGREGLQVRARAQFRGLCAVFALREALGLTVRLESVQLTRERDAFSRVLVPNLNAAPGGRPCWNRARFFTVQAPGGPPEVLAGLSPLTAIYPAATPPRTALAGVYWFDGETGTWYDPTGPELAPDRGVFTLPPATAGLVRGALKRWLGQALQVFTPGSLAPLGVEPRAEELVREELNAWLRELGGAVVADGLDVVDAPIPTPADEQPETVPRFLNPVGRGVGSLLLSDLPLVRGRLVVTRSQLADRTRRVWGRLFGQPDWAARADALPATGPNLGDALGLGAHVAPVGFVVVDKLFTPRLTFLTSNGELSKEWAALPVQNGSVTEYALLPFEPEILTLLSKDELISRVSAELAQDNQNYIVRLRFGDREVTRLYSISGEGAYAVDDVVPPDTLDVRLFPNFDLDAVRPLLPTTSDGRQPDATYYARVRLGPDWPFDVRAFQLQGDAAAQQVTFLRNPDKRGSTHLAHPPGAYPPGEALFFTLPERPDGFYFGGRGLCLVRLHAPFAAGAMPSTWDVGVDFGTSNTCVAIRGEGAPETLDFPILTTTLFARPPYGAILNTNEGASAAFDFFYKFQAGDRQLNEQPYFPTQILTQQEQIGATRAPEGEIDLAAGLIHFRNVNLTGAFLLELTQEFGLDREEGMRPLTRRFRLEQDIKWSRREWLRVFMAHLRKQVVLSAAARNARIARARFSYPRAFTRAEEVLFREEVTRAWGQGLLDPQGALLTESEAVRHTLAVNANQHVVFDVGGGTTDLIAFDAQHPVLQTSFKLAARHLNGYVAASPAFRDAFAKAAVDVLGEDYYFAIDLFRGEGRSEKQVMNAWVGLLQSLENRDQAGHALAAVVMKLQDPGVGERQALAVRGFFLSAALLFGGLSFFAGRLLKAASEGRFDPAGRPFALTGVTLTFTGNGSKLYRLLSPPHDDFGPVIDRLFRVGLGLESVDPLSTRFAGIYTLGNVLAPKVTVALGLLQQNGAAAVDLPVANLLGETLPPEPGAENDWRGDSLAAFYARAGRYIRSFVPPRAAPPEFAAFLDALASRLPRGLNGRHAVIPSAGTNWHEALKGEVFAQASPRIKDRVHEAVKALGKDAEALEGGGEVPALEPLFISELMAVLDQIRADHA